MLEDSGIPFGLLGQVARWNLWAHEDLDLPGSVILSEVFDLVTLGAILVRVRGGVFQAWATEHGWWMLSLYESASGPWRRKHGNQHGDLVWPAWPGS